SALVRIDRKNIGANDPDPQSGFEPHEGKIAYRALAPLLSAVEGTVKDAVDAVLDVLRERQDQFEDLMACVPMHAQCKMRDLLLREDAPIGYQIALTQLPPLHGRAHQCAGMHRLGSGPHGVHCRDISEAVDTVR